MSDNILNIKSHRSGGKFTPYEKYHLTKEQWLNLTQYADYNQKGIMPSGVKDYIKWSLPPNSSNAPGKKGQKAIDENYLYICVQDNLWKRVTLDISF